MLRTCSFALCSALAVMFVGSGCESLLRGRKEVSVGFSDVKPIFEESCMGCHQGSVLGAPVPDFRLRSGMIDAGYVVPGEPESSSLLEKVYAISPDSKPMPPIGHALPSDKRNLIGEWILQGAQWPDGETLAPAVMDREL